MPFGNENYKRIPVRAVHEGVDQYGSFLKYYDYYDFRPNLTSEWEFKVTIIINITIMIKNMIVHFIQLKIPEGYYCEDKKSDKKLPEMGTHFRFSEEIHSANTLRTIKDVYYTFDDQLVRFESRNSIPEVQSFYDTDPIVYINDYKMGLEYAINKVRGNCTVSTVRSYLDEQYTQQMVTSGLGFSVKLKSPKDFLGLDGNFTYMGSRIINNIPSDVYVSKVDIEGTSFVKEYTFTAVS